MASVCIPGWRKEGGMDSRWFTALPGVLKAGVCGADTVVPATSDSSAHGHQCWRPQTSACVLGQCPVDDWWAGWGNPRRIPGARSLEQSPAYWRGFTTELYNCCCSRCLPRPSLAWETATTSLLASFFSMHFSYNSQVIFWKKSESDSIAVLPKIFCSLRSIENKIHSLLPSIQTCKIMGPIDGAASLPLLYDLAVWAFLNPWNLLSSLPPARPLSLFPLFPRMALLSSSRNWALLTSQISAPLSPPSPPMESGFPGYYFIIVYFLLDANHKLYLFCFLACLCQSPQAESNT